MCVKMCSDGTAWACRTLYAEPSFYCVHFVKDRPAFPTLAAKQFPVNITVFNYDTRNKHAPPSLPFSGGAIKTSSACAAAHQLSRWQWCNESSNAPEIDTIFPLCIQDRFGAQPPFAHSQYTGQKKKSLQVESRDWKIFIYLFLANITQKRRSGKDTDSLGLPALPPLIK